VLPFRDVFDTYNLHYYLSVRAPRLGYRVKEVPVARIYPESGPTPTKISGLAGKSAILKLLWMTVMGKYNPN
jgi:dolichol-phosphate mannosyltransferase